MNRLPLRDLVLQKPKPETTLSLAPAFRRQARNMVENYVFTPTISRHAVSILDSVARGVGQGFWVQAEYGAGKTHFLVALAALLTHPGNDLWDLVAEEEIRNLGRRIGSTRLFPVVLSLRGEGGADSVIERSLMDVFLEQGVERAVEDCGLRGQVQVTSADDLLDWVERRASPAIRKEAEDFILKRTGRSLQAYRDDEGPRAVAELLSEYFVVAGIKPETPSSVKARLKHIYDQLTASGGPGYDGLLVVIDEYEGWDKAHSTPNEQVRDAEFLETLAWLLPRDLGCRVYTIVASQSAVPTKLRGDQAGDRFISLPLLAQGTDHEYDVIVSRRVRDLNGERLPEVTDHYSYCTQHFTFAQGLSEAEFRDIFPFQPRCFEVVRRITSRELPTTRSGLFVFWEVMNRRELLERDMLIRVADLLHSDHLVQDCLNTHVYKDAYQAYRSACELMLNLVEEGDLPLARDVLSTLFLWYLAYMEQPRRLDLHELAQATLTTDDVMRAEDNVAYVLGQLRRLQQIDFDNQSVVFKPVGSKVSLLALFENCKRSILKDRYRLQSAWSESLFFTPHDTGGPSGLFSDFQPDERVSKRVQTRNLEYGGEVIVSTSWRLDQGVPLPKDDVHFRLVFLTPSAAQTVRQEDLQDPRIAVVLPAEMTEEAREAAAGYLAWRQMSEEYKEGTGNAAEEMRSWLANQKLDLVGKLVSTHLSLYKVGRILTRDDLAISASEAIGQPGANDRRIQFIVERLLAAAYQQLPIEFGRLRDTLTAGELGKLFRGYFDRDAKPADRAATKNYGVGLGLSHPEQPEKFAPQQVRVFDLIREKLAARAGGELPVWQLYDSLSGLPFGLPYAVIQFMLLAFVRYGHPERVDLLLKSSHGLQDLHRQPLTNNRLTAGTVVNLDWRPGLERHFDALVPGTGPTWNDVLPYAREVVDDLRATTDQADIEAQGARLVTGVQKLHGEVEALSRNLNVLATTLGADVPEQMAGAMERLDRLTSEPEDLTFASFYERAEEVFNRNPQALREANQTYIHLHELAANAAEIGAVKRYLDEVQLRSSDRELAADRMTLLTQLSLAGLAEDPSTWNRLRVEFDRFKKSYQNVYQKHHRDFYKKASELRDGLADVPRQLDALDLLNSIERLKPSMGDDLRGPYQTLMGRLRPCPVTVVTEVSVDRAPCCDRCGLPLTAALPDAEIAAFQRDLKAALAGKQRQLAAETITRILARNKEPKLDILLDAIRAADLAALVDVMSPELVQLIASLLADEDIVTIDANVLRQLAGQHPSLEETEIDAVLDEFRQLLQEAFARAKAENPGKETIRLNLGG